MSEDQSQDTKTIPTRAYDAFAVRNDKDGNGRFHKVGAAFAHKDGKGYDIDMVATPSNGRLTLRTPQERLETQRGEERGATNGASRERE